MLLLLFSLHKTTLNVNGMFCGMHYVYYKQLVMISFANLPIYYSSDKYRFKIEM